jgi:hypothetical protein
VTRKLSHWLGVLLAIIVIAAAPFVVYQLVKIFFAASPNVKLGILTAVISVGALLYNNSRQQRREIASRHFTEKREAYQKFFDILFEFMQAAKTEIAPDAPVERIGLIVKSIMVWGSAKTINAYNAFMQHTAVQNSDASQEADDTINLQTFDKMETLLKSMRNDLGHSDGKLGRLSLSKLFVKGDEHYKFGL